MVLNFTANTGIGAITITRAVWTTTEITATFVGIGIPASMPLYKHLYERAGLRWKTTRGRSDDGNVPRRILTVGGGVFEIPSSNATSARNSAWKPKRESRSVAFRALGDEECAPFTKKYERGREEMQDGVNSLSSLEDIELCAVEGAQGGVAVYGTNQGPAGSSSSVARLGQERELPPDAFGKNIISN